MFGKGIMKKVLMYMMLGPMALLLGGSFNMMDFFLVPMLVPMFSGMFGNMGLPGSGGTAGATT